MVEESWGSTLNQRSLIQCWEVDLCPLGTLGSCSWGPAIIRITLCIHVKLGHCTDSVIWGQAEVKQCFKIPYGHQIWSASTSRPKFLNVMSKINKIAFLEENHGYDTSTSIPGYSFCVCNFNPKSLKNKSKQWTRSTCIPHFPALKGTAPPTPKKLKN